MTATMRPVADRDDAEGAHRARSGASGSSPAGGGRRIAPMLLVLVPVVGAVAVAMRVIATAGHGLDFSDEGMYLLSADNGSPGTAFHNAFGRYTGPLFALVGHDVARFRVLGVMILLVAAVVAADRAAIAAGRLRGVAATGAERVLAGTVVSVAAMHYYGLLLVTPSYNWLNLVGILLAVGASVEVVTDPRPDSRRARWAWPSMVSVGLAVSTMGKVSSGPILATAVAVGLVASGDGAQWRRLAPLCRCLPAAAVIAGLHALVVNPWSTTWHQVRRGNELLAALDPLHYSLRTALRDVWRAAVLVVQAVPTTLAPGIALAVAGSWWVAQDPARRRWHGALLAGTTVVLAVSVAGRGTWMGGQAGYGNTAWAGVAVTVVAAAASWPWWRSSSGRPARAAVVPAGVAVVPLAGAFAYAFASGNGFFPQAGASLPAVAVLAVIALLVAAAPTSSSGRGLPLATLGVVLAVGGWSLIGGATERPYRQVALVRATEEIEIGPAGGTLRVSPDTARYVSRLREVAAAAGWRRGDPMLDLSWYSATSLYALGAEPPPTVLVSVGGYDHVDDMARLTLREAARVDGPRWREAWLLTTDGPPEAGEAPDPTLVRLIGRSFPDDYERLATLAGPTGSVQVWKPKERR